MAQNYRHQNESGRSQDYPRGGYRNAGRDRYETGNERRFTPEQEERGYEASSQFDDSGFEGDRSYSAGGYPEEFGYRREGYGERERSGSYRGGYQEGREPGRFSGSGQYGRNPEYAGRDFGQSAHYHAGSSRHEPGRYRYPEVNRGEDFSRDQGGRAGYYGSGDYSSTRRGPADSSYGAQGNLGPNYGSGQGWGNEQSQQSHRGRGPKGYERSDERLKEMICERLTDDPAIDASEITVEVTNKIVKLTGTVEDRRVKYMIEDVIEQCGGFKDIDNQLRIQAPSSQYGTSSTDSSFGRSTDNRPGILGSTTGTGTPSTKRN